MLLKYCRLAKYAAWMYISRDILQFFGAAVNLAAIELSLHASGNIPQSHSYSKTSGQSRLTRRYLLREDFSILAAEMF